MEEVTGTDGQFRVDNCTGVQEIQYNENALRSLRETLAKIPNIGGYRVLYGHFMKPNKASTGGIRTSVLPQYL